jgi:CRISPR-associated protein Csb2
MTTVRLALAGKPLPRIEDAVRIGELVRVAAISAADRTAGPEHIPPEISGHGETQELNHQHAFYLPEDANDDGRIDHVLIHAPGGLSPAAVTALASIQRLWTEDGAEWNVVFEGAWPEPDSSRSIHGGRAATWTSLTPYLHPWHAKPGFGVAEQVRRECKRRGLPAPIGVRLLPSVRIRDRERRPVHFHRFRSRRGLRQPDRRGSLVEITFGEVVAGPLALGFGCHYGLGMFVPSGG